jgi:hypothetical protein
VLSWQVFSAGLPLHELTAFFFGPQQDAVTTSPDAFAKVMASVVIKLLWKDQIRGWLRLCVVDSEIRAGSELTSADD